MASDAKTIYDVARLSLLAALLTTMGCDGVVVSQPSSLARCSSDRVVGIVYRDGAAVYLNGQPVANGQEVCLGDEVSTGAASSARVDLRQGGYVQLDELTDPWFLLFEQGGCLVVRLIKGQAFAHARRVCIETPEVATLLNSQVNLKQSDGTSEFTVIEGQLDFTNPRHPSLTTGQKLVLVHGQPREPVRSLDSAQLHTVTAWREKYFRSAPSPPPQPTTGTVPKNDPTPAAPPSTPPPAGDPTKKPPSLQASSSPPGPETPPSPDGVAPSTPTGLSPGSLNEKDRPLHCGSVELTWSAAKDDRPGPVTYVVSVAKAELSDKGWVWNAPAVTSTTPKTKHDIKLALGDTIRWRVQAEDAAGNRSSQTAWRHLLCTIE